MKFFKFLLISFLLQTVLTLVTNAVIEGLANRTSDKEGDATTDEATTEVVEVADTKAEEAAVVAEAKTEE